MFRGATRLTLDAKGRLAVPARYRAQLDAACKGHLIVTIDPDSCLLLYPGPTWDEIERKLMQLPSLEPQARRVLRLMVGHATEVDIDDHGRVRLPRELREFAGLDRMVMLIGQGHKFELWDEARWNEGRDSWLKEPLSVESLPPGLQSVNF